LDERLASFVERATGARVAASARLGAGASRATWRVTLATGAECVLRADTGDGPMAGTPLTLAREAAVYAALGGGPVPIPRLLAAKPEGDALLVALAPGTESLDGLAQDARTLVMDAYVDALAALHAVDADRLALPGFARPAPDDPARPELALWRAVLEARVTRPAPLARFAFAWLERHAPRHADRIALCHGDVGPGNFLQADGRITALLDWEFAHLGDPLDDLAWLSFRGHHLKDAVGDLDAQLARWSERTSLAADRPRIAWYRALVMLRMLVACHAALDSGAASLDRTVYFSLAALLECLLPRALAELAGVALEPAPAPPAPAATEDAEVLASLATDLSGALLPELPGALQARARGNLLLLVHLQAADRFGAAVRSAERARIAEALGRDEGDAGRARAALAERVAVAEPGEDERWIRLLAELGGARIALWPYLAALAAKPLAKLV
jgi:aminoglycoside phosphotransferase (APT) family kinase protein